MLTPMRDLRYMSVMLMSDSANKVLKGGSYMTKDGADSPKGPFKALAKVCFGRGGCSWPSLLFLPKVNMGTVDILVCLCQLQVPGVGLLGDVLLGA